MDNWNKITTEEDFFALVEKSKDYPQIIFKDSVTCGISAYAKERLVNGNDEMTSKATFNYLDLLAHRPISNLIAQELDVSHQSPQIIVLKNAKVTYTVTHHSIDPIKISEQL